MRYLGALVSLLFACAVDSRTVGVGMAGDGPDTPGGGGRDTGGEGPGGSGPVLPNTPGTRALGEACAAALDCVSSFCTDGVCCEAACDGACQACGSDGSCGPTGGDSGACSVGTGACDGGVSCEPPPLSEECSASPAPDPVQALSPLRGAYTGSLNAPADRLTLRPTLTWSASTGCAPLHYQIQMDDSCLPGELATCAWDSPEVDSESSTTSFQAATDLPISQAAPVGAFYAWRVRACDGAERCSSYSDPAYLHVGRTPEDIDGDGFADALVKVGADFLDVYLGGAGFDSQADGQIPLPAGAYSVRHAGDLDGDGFADLALISNVFEVCASAGGYPEVIFGGTDIAALRTQSICGVAGSPSVTFQTGNTGDVDGDGFADLGLTREFQDSRFLLLRGGNAVQGVPALDLDITISGAAGTYPHTLGDRTFDGGGDFNGDGYADVFVSGRGTTEPLFTTRLFLGAPSLPASMAANFDFELTQSENSPLVTRLGDVNQDGRDDWAFGMGIGLAEPGRVGVALGSGTLPSAFDAVWVAPSPLLALSRLLDFDRDGADEVFVAPGGALLLLRSNGTFSDIPNTSQLSADKRLSTADHNGDGRDDLLLQSIGTGTFTVRWAAAAASFTVTPIALLPFAEAGETATRDIVY
jgi:VCBS repeat protein